MAQARDSTESWGLQEKNSVEQTLTSVAELELKPCRFLPSQLSSCHLHKTQLLVKQLIPANSSLGFDVGAGAGLRLTEGSFVLGTQPHTHHSH